jgi:sulfite exporter TauE/SafE
VVIDQPKVSLLERVKAVLIFLVLGPPIGAVPIMFLYLLVARSYDAAQKLTGGILMILYSYVPGGIPALLTGIIFQWLIYRRQIGTLQPNFSFLAFISAFFITSTLAFVFFGFTKHSLAIVIGYGLLSAFAAALCAYIDGRRRGAHAMNRVNSPERSHG